MALALPTVFAACTADDILEQGSNASMAERKVVGEISFVNSDAQGRLVFEDGKMKWTETDKLGAALMDTWKGTTTPANPAADYLIVDRIFSNYQYDYDGTGFSNGNATLVEGNYFVYAQYNKDQKRSGLAYSIETSQETGTGYDAWYKNQFYLDHIFVKQGDSEVGVNVLPVFPKVNMAIAYEGASSDVQVRKVIVYDYGTDATDGFGVKGAVTPELKTVSPAYDALANLGAKAITGKTFVAANYQVSNGSLADVFNAYKKALKDYEDGVFELAEGKSAANFTSPNIKTFITPVNAERAESMTLNYTTPAASVKGVMVLPLSEAHATEDLVLEIYTNKGLVTIAGKAISMSNAFTFNAEPLSEGENPEMGKKYATEDAPGATLKDKAKNAVRFNSGITKAFVTGLAADGLQKVEIGFKDNAILVPNTLTVTTTEELKYYLTNWYTGKKDKVEGDPVDKNTVTVYANPGEGQKVEIDNEVLAFINNANNPSLKFKGTIEIKAGTSAEAINKIANGGPLTVINNATQTWTATQSFTNLINKSTLTVGTGAQDEVAVYTVGSAIVNEGTLTINKSLAAPNAVYNVGTLTVNADLTSLLNGVAEVGFEEDEIVATAVANLANGKEITALTNYAIVNVTNAIVGTSENNATININGTLKTSGATVNNSAYVLAANSKMTVTNTFENAEDATITNNGEIVVSTSAGKLTNYGKIVNNSKISCNADGASLDNYKDMEANSKSITLISKNYAGAEILVADNTAIINIPNAVASEGKVTFIVDENADLNSIPACSNSLRVTATEITLTDVKGMVDKRFIEFRSKEDMTINYYSKLNGLGVETEHSTFKNVKFNSDGATSEVRFTTNGNLDVQETLEVSKNVMIVVNNNMKYNDAAYNFNNAGQLYIIGKLIFTEIEEPTNAGKAFMGNVYCTGGETSNIEWASVGTSSEAIVAEESKFTEAIANPNIETITLVGEVKLTSNLNVNKDITIKGGTISGKTVNVSSDNVKFEGVTFSGAKNGADASSIVWVDGKTVTIEGCTFEGAYEHDAIQLGNFDDDAVVVIKNNTFITPTTANAKGSYLHIVASTAGDISSTAKVTIEGNTFGSFDKFTDNPIKCYGLAEYSQWIVGKNTFASAFKEMGSWSRVQVGIFKGYYKNLITPGYNQKNAYNSFIADEVKPLN